VHEVPHLDCAVARTCEDVVAAGVEFHRTHPVPMALPRHYQL
jgi:hypothetical protein